LGKVLAFVLAFALVLPFAGGAKVQALAGDEPVTFVVDGGQTSVSLEIGDTFTLNIGLKSATNGVLYLDGDLELPSEYFTISEFTPVDSDKWTATWTDGASDDIKSIAVYPQNDAANGKGIDVSASTVLAQVKVEVKKAVESTKYIKLSGTSVVTKNTENAASGGEQTITLTNSVTAHKVDLTVPDTLKVPVGGVAELGDVELPIKIGDTNTGFTGLHIIISYDKSKLVYKGYSLSDAVTRSSGGSQQIDVRESDGSIAIAFSAAKDIKLTKDALFLTLTFAAASGATAGDTATIIPTFADDDSAFINQSGVTMTASFNRNCAVTFFKGYNPGDVNMDGSINLIDATYILQGYNGSRTLTEAQKKLADVNGTGTVTLVDALLIMKYYNGTITSFN
jgi:hypothetical protein